MDFIQQFLDDLNDAICHKDVDKIMAMNMPDDITGWGLGEDDDYNERQSLHKALIQHYEGLLSAKAQFQVLDNFGNNMAAALVCRYTRDFQFNNGTQLQDDNLRFTFYLINQEGSWKIRHGHLSKPWPEQAPFPAKPIPERNHQGQPHQTVRLSDQGIQHFLAILSQRSRFTEAIDLVGLMSQQYPSQDNVFFPMQSPAQLQGQKEYQQFLESLKAIYTKPSLNYCQPVVFKNHSIACMSAYADATCQDKASGETIRISPLRVTYILQEHQGQWMNRHSHWSIPLPDSF